MATVDETGVRQGRELMRKRRHMNRFPLKRAAMASGAIVAMLPFAACGSSASGSGGDEWPDTLVFAQIPSESATGIAEDNAAILEALESELSDAAGKDITVELQEATGYAAVIEALRAGQVQVAGMGPFSYTVAKDDDAGVEPVGALADSADEPASYRSYGIVPKGSDITDLDGFEGKTVCFVDETSTSGYLFPSAGLMEAGLDPAKDVDPVFAGGHDASALSVADGTCDAGFAFDTMVTEELIESEQLAEGDLEVVWESEDIPNSPYVVSTDLPEDLQEEITRIFTEEINKPALVEMGVCDSEEDCTLPEGSEYGFIPVEDDLYDGIREVCDVTEAESCVTGG